MSGLFYNLGRHLGRAAIPVMRKSKWLWQSLAGNEAEAIEAETQFGRVLAAEMRQRWPPPDDPQDQAQVADIGRCLARDLPDPHRSFRFETVQSEEATAMALPGGFIFLSVPLLDLCQRQPDELAFLIGHEMAHVLRGHTIQRIIQQTGIGVVSAVLSRGRLNPWLRQSGAKLLQKAYSRENELEADEVGLQLAAAAGYDPKGVVRLFQRLSERRQAPEGMSEYFASHPPETVRLAHLKSRWAR